MKMTKLVRTTAHILFPLCLMYGLYIVSHGHLTPGGGFQGGAVMATAMALYIIAGRYSDVSNKVPKDSVKLCESIGLLGFLLAGGVALFLGKPLFYNWLANHPGALFGSAVAFGPNPGNLNTGGVMAFMNMAVGIEVVGALSVILLTMLGGLHHKEEAS